MSSACSSESRATNSTDSSARGKVFLNAIADGCRLSRQEVAWEFKYWKENR